MLNFIYHVPTKIYFGKGQIKSLGAELEKHAKKALIVTGQGSVKKHGIFDDVVKEFSAAGVPFAELTGVKPNPRLKSVYNGIDICKKEKADFILAVGGGSVIDTAKAIAAGVKYKGDVWDFFTKDIVCEDALPLGTVLTLAATGSEMDTYAVITNEQSQRKLAFGSKAVRPVFSILDPEYTYTVTKYNTAAGIADIMTHIFEEYFSEPYSAAVPDRMSEALLKVCVHYGPVACENPRDYEARANILWTSSLALNDMLDAGKRGDWASHAIEHELSAIYDISHGVGLAIIVPNWMRFVLNNDTARKLADYGKNVWNIDGKNEMEIANKAIDKTISFFKSLGLPSRLKEIDIGNEHFKKMAESAIECQGEVGSFKSLSASDIVEIFKMSL
ncbi:MAG: iron-containing alcohol dehydrogenase [Candidatus Omnitrophica bacterium]|nr:iron-containing alcohol dehydrogenase [Candidatus Omnitrophota bacterium]